MSVFISRNLNQCFTLTLSHRITYIWKRGLSVWLWIHGALSQLSAHCFAEFAAFLCGWLAWLYQSISVIFFATAGSCFECKGSKMPPYTTCSAASGRQIQSETNWWTKWSVQLFWNWRTPKQSWKKREYWTYIRQEETNTTPNESSCCSVSAWCDNWTVC